MNHSADYIFLSALQHWLFCPRQYALIHIERLWAENRFTAEGRLLHERTDIGQHETRPGVRVLRSVEISSLRHGLYGVTDVVELRDGYPYPVEYKRGKPKTHRADEIQLCGQALCLEEMFNCEILEGALFYGKIRRRVPVFMDAELRGLTLSVADSIRQCQATGRLPTATYDPVRCDRCSLLDQCQPKLGRRRNNVVDWVKRALDEKRAPE